MSRTHRSPFNDTRLTAAQPGALAKGARAARLGLAAVVVSMLLFLGSATVPNLVGLSTLVVTSGSMAPAVPVGSVVVVDPRGAGSLRVGDIGTFHDPAEGSLVTHRVVAVSHDARGEVSYRTRGDANDVQDAAPRSAAQTVGRVLYVLPFAGYAIVALNTLVGRLALALVAVALVGASLAERGRKGTDGAEREGAGGTQDEPNVGAELLLERGRAALALGRNDLAEHMADEILARDPRHEGAWLLKAAAASTPTDRRARLLAARAVLPGSERLAVAFSAAETERALLTSTSGVGGM